MDDDTRDEIEHGMLAHDGAGGDEAAAAPTSCPVSRKIRQKRRTRARSKTIAPKRLTKEELRFRALLAAGRRSRRPTTRGECKEDMRPVPVRLVQAPPLSRRQSGDGQHQAQLPGPRVWELAEHLLARRRRPRRHHARGGRRDHEPDARAHPPGRGPRPAQAEDGVAVARRARRASCLARRRRS